MSFSATLTETGTLSFSTDKISELAVLFSTTFTFLEISSIAMAFPILSSTVTTSSTSAVSITSETFSDALTTPTASNEIITIEIINKPQLTFMFLFSS